MEQRRLRRGLIMEHGLKAAFVNYPRFSDKTTTVQKHVMHTDAVAFTADVIAPQSIDIFVIEKHYRST